MRTICCADLFRPVIEQQAPSRRRGRPLWARIASSLGIVGSCPRQRRCGPAFARESGRPWARRPTQTLDWRHADGGWRCALRHQHDRGASCVGTRRQRVQPRDVAHVSVAYGPPVPHRRATTIRDLNIGVAFRSATTWGAAREGARPHRSGVACREPSGRGGLRCTDRGIDMH